MTIDERIKYAEQKRDEAFSNDSVQSIVYWDGYIAALKAVRDRICLIAADRKMLREYADQEHKKFVKESIAAEIGRYLMESGFIHFGEDTEGDLVKILGAFHVVDERRKR